MCKKTEIERGVFRLILERNKTLCVLSISFIDNLKPKVYSCTWPQLYQSLTPWAPKFPTIYKNFRTDDQEINALTIQHHFFVISPLLLQRVASPPFLLPLWNCSCLNHCATSRMMVESSMLPFRMMMSSGLLRIERSPGLVGRRNVGMTRPRAAPAKKIARSEVGRILKTWMVILMDGDGERSVCGRRMDFNGCYAGYIWSRLLHQVIAGNL